MPKTNEGRTTDAEANLARRIAHERERRGLSYEALAKAMTEAGCKIQGSAIYKIEKGDKQTGKLRRITVNELTAFAEVFETSVSDLLTDMELLGKQRAEALIDQYLEAMRHAGDLSTEIFNALFGLFSLSYEDADLGEYLAHRLNTSVDRSRFTVDSRGVDEDGEVVADFALLTMVKAAYDQEVAMRKAALTWAAYRVGDWDAKRQRQVQKELDRLRTELADMQISREEDED